MRRPAWFGGAVAAAIAAATALLSALALAGDVFFTTNLRLTDALFPGAPADPRIVVVAVDDASIERVGRWPWDRDVHADLIRTISADDARVIAYDVLFAAESDPTADAALAAALIEAGDVVLAEQAVFAGSAGEDADVLTATELYPPIPALAGAAAAVGHVNVFPDADGVVRALPPVVAGPDGSLVPALSLEVAATALGAAGPVAVQPGTVTLGGLAVPVGDLSLLDVNFASGFTTVSAADVLDGLVPDATFAGAIVFVGATAPGLGDLVTLPTARSTRSPGVLLHANAVNTILSGRYLDPEGAFATLGWVALLALIAAAAAMYLRWWAAVPVAVGIIVVFFLLAFRRFDDAAVVMNLVFPPLGAVVGSVSTLGYRFLVEARERRYVTGVFGRYLAEDVVDEILASPDEPVATLSGSARTLAVLFADLRGFTSASQDARPEDVVTALNRYLEAMTSAVNDEKGTVDKFIGDCVMAFWGAPRAEPDAAVRAVRAAVAMLDRIDAALAEERTRGLLPVEGCGIGITLGPAVVGNIGSTTRLDYTAIGDTVNTSSRLCGIAGAGEIVVTQEVAAALGGAFATEPMPPVEVKGKDRPLAVARIVRPGRG